MRKKHIYSTYLRPGDTVYVDGVYGIDGIGKYFYLTEYSVDVNINSSVWLFYNIGYFAVLVKDEKNLRRADKFSNENLKIAMRFVKGKSKMLLTERL
jgi:hypothetical protein